MYVQLLTILACWCINASVASAVYYDLESAATYFEEFIAKFEKQYINEHEKASRFEKFKLNLEKINRLNEESDHAVFGITKFADLTTEEVEQQYTGLRKNDDNIHLCHMLYDEDIVDVDAPESLDWREFNAVTAVKDQGGCRTCWAFSATGHLEGQQAIKHNQLLELSQQQIIDCDKISDGCCGGYIATAMKAAIKTGGVMLAKDYPYVSKKSSCRTDLSKVVVKVTDCFSYNLTSQEKVKQLLYKIGPISIGVRGSSIPPHINGILSDKHCKEGNINHSVLLVGYGSENNKPYWIVKNSWGKDFGEAGYFRMERSENPDGACGMLNAAITTAVIE